MRRILPLWLFVCLFAVAAANPQTVNETESSAILNETNGEFSLVAENPAQSFDAEVRLEILGAGDEIHAVAAQNLRIKSGKEVYKIKVPLGDMLKDSGGEISWYRLRYQLGNATGVVSLSELMKNVFELRVAVSETVVAGTNYRARVRALHPFTNQPAAGVLVEGDLKLDAEPNELNLKAAGETDADGFALLDFKIPENARIEDADLKILARRNGIVREIEEELEANQSSGSVFLTVDKPLYQPGQNFSARALYFDASQRAVDGGELQFTIKDEEGTVLYRETTKTSAFGIASIGWKIPENAKLGSYRVEVEADDELREDSLRFKVSRYDLPQFAVAATPDKSFYLPEDKTAEITVKADYLFGKPVTKGRVRVVQESGRRWNYREQKYDIEEEQAFEGETNAKGKFVVRVNLFDAFAKLRSSEWRRFDDLNFAAYFTDSTTNRTEQRRFDVRLSKEPIHVYLIGRTINQNPKLPVTAYVSTFYADGSPAACDVEIRGEYEDEIPEKLLARIKTNRLGAGKIEFSAPPTKDSDSDFQFKITARDPKGRSGTFNEEVDFDDDDSIKILTEKTVFKPGESLKIKLVSTQPEALVYLDVSKDWAAIESRFVRLKNGRGEIKIPYNPNFKGELTLAAYTDDKSGGYYDSEMRAARGILYPESQNLKLDARFSSAAYQPNEEARVNFAAASGDGKPLESALGVVVFDRAIEERARTDEEFGGYFSRFYGLLGYEKSFGGITLKDLNELDASKPVSPEIQLAAEIMLADSYYSPRIRHTKRNDTAAMIFYAAFFKKQFAPVEEALKKRYAVDYAHPTDEPSLRRILQESGVDFDALRDPWGRNYRAIFTIDKTQNVVTFRTDGADKKTGTPDDFNVSSLSFAYFTPVGKAIDRAVFDYYKRTGNYIRDLQTLSAELAKQNVDLKRIKDIWGRNYRIAFEILGRNYVIRFRSLGENGVYQPTDWNRDDFDVWINQIDYFAETEARINGILSEAVNKGGKPFPSDEAELRRILSENGLDFDRIRDGYGAPVYLAEKRQTRYADKTVVENGKQIITPVTQEVVTFTIRSKGSDGLMVTPNFSDDFDLATFSSVITEASKDTNFSKADVKTFAFSGAKGAIRGVVYDFNGAVIPNAAVTATSEQDLTKTFGTTTNEEGAFLLENIPSGTYSIKAEAVAFQTAVYQNVQVRSQNLVEIKFELSVGNVTETVTVTAASELSNTTNASVSNLVTANRDAPNVKSVEQTSTPRLREYFPETLLWQPELITDKNGKAELKFKLADNITTWKLYAVGSTKNGKIGVAETEIKAFQPFFVDLEPPKFLTEGDEINLPVQIRNYTERRERVGVSMAAGDWFNFLNDQNQQIEVAAGETNNAIFGFRAISAVAGGKQRVTATAQKTGDAVEKPVTVRPNGQEIVKTESKIFERDAAFDVNFPAETLPRTQRAELKIYPNLFSHVAESVEGLLQRPYGCGEQTVSSTYPNVMILKFVREDSALQQKAQKYLQKGYERLLGYQTAEGGFSYWGAKDAPDAALTAYALRFLNDAKPFVEVDEKIIERAQNWLVKQQRADGSWAKTYYWQNAADESQTKLFTAYVARVLAMQKAKGGSGSFDAVLQKALGYLKIRTAEIDEPYALALYGLALLDAGNAAEARAIAERLEKMAIPEADAVYWKLETNTPFYGWGTAGRVETTALVVQLLTRIARADVQLEDAGTQKKEINRNGKNTQDERSRIPNRGVAFLLKNKDRYGVWYSTQTTVNVLDAFLTTLDKGAQTAAQTFEISMGGARLQSVTVAPDRIEPLVFDLNEKIQPLANRVEIKSSSGAPVMAQLVAGHFVDWKNADVFSQAAGRSRALRLEYQCDKTDGAIMQEVTCAVGAERIGFKGYGMLLAEIGVPPGADVSRESLQKAMEADWSFSRYDILPDRIVIYMWAKAGGTRINFKFKPRYGLSAQTPASVVYDYYNPEAQATVAPLKFNVK